MHKQNTCTLRHCAKTGYKVGPLRKVLKTTDDSTATSFDGEYLKWFLQNQRFPHVYIQPYLHENKYYNQFEPRKSSLFTIIIWHMHSRISSVYVSFTSAH